MDLSGCTRIAGIDFAGGCGELRVLRLNECCELVDIGALGCGLNGSEPGQGNAIQRIELENAMSLVDLAALAACQAMESLSLRGCDQIVCIAALAHCTALLALDMAGCDWLASP